MEISPPIHQFYWPVCVNSPVVKESDQKTTQFKFHVCSTNNDIVG